MIKLSFKQGICAGLYSQDTRSGLLSSETGEHFRDDELLDEQRAGDVLVDLSKGIFDRGV